MSQGCTLPLAVLILLAAAPLSAQNRPPPKSLAERLRELEQRVADLEAEAEEQRDLQAEVEKNYAKGIVTLGGLRFRLGGQAKIDFIDPQNENDPTFGATESPDPHLEVERLRLVPRVLFPRSKVLGDFSLRAQLDFHPTQGDTILKEATLDHELAPEWWVASHLKIGLDDRFIRPQRLTQNYPLIGTAFWRDESVAIFWEGTLGDKRGKPEKKPKGGKKAAAAEAADAAEEMEASGAEEERRGEEVPARSARTRSTTHGPFDFAGNPGALKLHFSIGDGYGANDKEIGRDDAPFNAILQDDRNLDPPLTLREIGLGAGYERDFHELGEFELLGFYYDDELRDDARAFLNTNLDLTDDKRHKNFYGANAGYHFEAYHLYRALDIVDAMNPRRGDGLSLFYEWISAQDGDLERDGWYAQASYRISNPAAWRFLRSIEPVARYGELKVDVPHVPSLPLTWARRQWLVGAILELARGVFIRTEYTFNDEATGGGSVSNNELLVQLLAEF